MYWDLDIENFKEKSPSPQRPKVKKSVKRNINDFRKELLPSPPKKRRLLDISNIADDFEGPPNIAAKAPSKPPFKPFPHPPEKPKEKKADDESDSWGVPYVIQDEKVKTSIPLTSFISDPQAPYPKTDPQSPSRSQVHSNHPTQTGAWQEYKFSKKDKDKKKLFIGNIDQKVSPAHLKTYMETFGELESFRILNANRPNMNHRGFGFATFKSPDNSQKFESKNHVFQGKTLNVSIAVPETRGFLVMGLNPERSSKKSLEKFFSTYGQIAELQLSPQAHFAFVILYESPELHNLKNNPFHKIDGAQCEIRPGRPQDHNMNMQGQPQGGSAFPNENWGFEQDWTGPGFYSQPLSPGGPPWARGRGGYGRASAWKSKRPFPRRYSEYEDDLPDLRPPPAVAQFSL